MIDGGRISRQESDTGITAVDRNGQAGQIGRCIRSQKEQGAFYIVVIGQAPQLGVAGIIGTEPLRCPV